MELHESAGMFAINNSLALNQNSYLNGIQGEFLPFNQIAGMKNIAFIDRTVQNYQNLVAGIIPNTEIVLLDPTRDGVEQITEILGDRTGISSAHIITHGNEASLQLGTTQLSLTNLDRYRASLEQWKNALTVNADIILYGCKVAAGETGTAFVQSLSEITEADIAASDDLTGNAEFGGDWAFEVKTGKIEAKIALEAETMAGYDSVLLSFAPVSNFPVTPSLRNLAVGDFNKDSNTDLVMASTGFDYVSTILGTGTGSFGTATKYSAPLGIYTWAVAVGDVNKDGNLDLATANNGNNNVSILLGNGTGNFGTATNFNVGSGPYSVALADFNQDGNLDLTTANRSSGNVSILLGNGTGNFGTANNFTVGSSPSCVVVGDFNQDGKLDLATANQSSNNISILLGDGTGKFGTATNFSTGGSTTAIVTKDFNQDGNLDLATANGYSNNVSVLLGDGKGNFGTATNYTVGNETLFIAAGDLDGDGNIDLATADNLSNQVSVLLGTATGNFKAATTFAVGTYPQGIVIADLNKDSLLDIATANFGSQNVSILLNSQPLVNFGAVTYKATEESSDNVVNIPITLSATPGTDVTVPIVINNGSTATEGVSNDFILSTNSVTFKAGATGNDLTQNIAVTIKPDNIAENDETVVLDVGAITGAVAGVTKQTTLTIGANDAIDYAVKAGVANIPEGNSGTTPLTFTVTRSGGIDAASKVDFAIGGTATNNSDYKDIGGTSGATATTGTITFAAGETQKTVTMNIVGDTAFESDETVIINLSNPVAPGPTPTISTASATTTINNDDALISNVVTNTKDSGDGSLRQVITWANSNPGKDSIVFNIPTSDPGYNSVTGAFKIGLTSELPTITDAVILDATTQPGFSSNPIIELNGSNAGAGVSGLRIWAGNSTVKGLVINSFNGTGVVIWGSSGNTVQGNYIGTDVTGTAALSNTDGLVISWGTNNLIGGTAPGTGNVISGNTRLGIGLFNVENMGTQVQGNYIGTKADGISPLGNGHRGVYISDTTNNTIGGTAAGAGNIIAFNGSGNPFFPGDGIFVERDDQNSFGNSILSNTIFSNAGLGIDIGSNGVTANDTGDGDTGANNLQNFPVLTSAISNGSNTTVTGTFNSTANTTFRLEFFSNTALDSSGYGEGQTFLGFTNVTTDNSGNANFTVNSLSAVPLGQYITATATNQTTNDTSEFSAGQVVNIPTPPTVTISATDAEAAEAANGQTPNPGQFTLTRTGNLSTPLTVKYTTSGTATNGSDYNNLSGSISFAANQSTVTLPINVINDNLVDGSETATVTITPDNAYTVDANNKATVFIADTITVPQIINSTLSATDPNNPTLSGKFRDDYRLTGVTPGQQVQLNLNAPFDAYLQLVNANTGQVIVSNDDSNGTYNSQLTFTAQSGIDYIVRVTSYRDGATGNYSLITSIPTPPTVTISAIDADAAEVRSGQTPNPGLFRITRTGSTVNPLTINYTTSGNATNGRDYDSLNGTIVIPAGQSSVNLPINVIDDRRRESVERAIVTLAPNSSYAIGTANNATVRISDNDRSFFNFFNRTNARLDSSSLLDSDFYLQQNTDVADAVANQVFPNALAHFSQFGYAEGRNPSAVFATDYLNENPDVAAAVAKGEYRTGFEHFIKNGMAEGREPAAEFRELETVYLAENSDVAQAVRDRKLGSGIEHLIKFGVAEGRNPFNLFNVLSETFDPDFYLARNRDVKDAIDRGELRDGLEHFVNFGRFEGRDPSTSFSNISYLAENEDVAAAIKRGTFKNGIEHYVKFGFLENRKPNNLSEPL